MEETHARPFMGADAEELKERIDVQHQMAKAIESLDFTNKEHWSVQLAQGDKDIGCWILAEHTMLPAVANTLVQTLTRVVEMADGFGPEHGIAVRLACMSAFKDINIMEPEGEA